MQFPALRHGDNVIADSSCIQAYLLRTYPDQLGALVPADPKQCAPPAPPHTPHSRVPYTALPGKRQMPIRAQGTWRRNGAEYAAIASAGRPWS